MASTNPNVIERGKEGVSTKQPPLYQVLLHNDHYTTMEFVVEILVRIFHKSFPAANHIMLSVHHTGVGVCGVYTYEIAETKVKTVLQIAEQNGFPLLCTFEKVDE